MWVRRLKMIYNYDAKGNFETKLAGGAYIKITTEISGE